MTETSADPVIWFDLPALALEHEINNSRGLKRGLVKQGYDKIMSLYGALRMEESLELIGIRIELLSRDSYRAEDIRAIYDYFNLHRYPFKYCIWTYNAENRKLNLEGVYP